MSTALAKRIDFIKEKTHISANNVAELLRTSPQTLSRWTTGKNEPQKLQLERLLELQYIVEQLADFFEPEEARLWLYSRHPLLKGERPADLIVNGQHDEVLAVIAQLRDSAYV